MLKKVISVMLSVLLIMGIFGCVCFTSNAADVSKQKTSFEDVGADNEIDSIMNDNDDDDVGDDFDDEDFDDDEDDNEIFVTKVTISKKSLKMSKGSSKTLTTKVFPSNAPYADFWYSSNNKVATVNNKGKIKAENLGKATITFQADHEGGEAKVDCKVTVNKATAKIKKGKSKSLKKLVKYIKGYKKAKWSSNKKNIVSVSKKGKIKAKKKGKATVTAKIKGTKYKITVKVK